MKTLFIGAKIKREPEYEKIIDKINSIPEKKIAICYSNQFVEIAKKISELIDKEVTAKVQVLGCSRPKFSKETQGILIIGQGNCGPASLSTSR